MKKTPWFNCREHKPVHPGPYEVKFDGAVSVVGLCRFNGGRWRKWETGPNAGYDAIRGFRPGFSSNDQWRGLTKKAD